VTTLRFTLAAALDSATAIPQGTRASTPENIYFATDDYAEIPAGSTYIDVPATCTETGAAANGIPIGEIQVLVDPIPYIESVSNIVASGGGADTESDEDLAERVYLAPSAYSTAGPEDSYIYHTKEYNPAIGDVVVTSDQAAGEVDVYFLMDDGSTPDATTISGLQAHLNDKTIRPMTDVVVVDAPAAENYTINLTYYINQSDSSQAVTIQSDVNQAITDYIQWQRHIGRDINPSKLISMIMAAGAKRVVVTYPVYTVVASTKVPTLSSDPTITYGGLEND
jgi:Phage-related baseplate assembly protein